MDWLSGNGREDSSEKNKSNGNCVHGLLAVLLFPFFLYVFVPVNIAEGSRTA